MDAKCKICRRVGTKLFLKGDKCLTSKCPLTLKSYAPGIKGKKRRRSFSEYGKELKEKQKLRNLYGLRESQFKKYVFDVLEKAKRGKSKEPADDVLIRRLENRLDNVVFRLGFTSSRAQARQFVSHGHFLVNGKSVNIPSFEVKKGDKIKVKSRSIKNNFFSNRWPILKNYKTPLWLRLNLAEKEGEVIGKPDLKEISLPANIASIFEFYSR